jgi:DNA repair exonuclease SbcCD ATPase subunit
MQDEPEGAEEETRMSKIKQLKKIKKSLEEMLNIVLRKIRDIEGGIGNPEGTEKEIREYEKQAELLCKRIQDIKNFLEEINYTPEGVWAEIWISVNGGPKKFQKILFTDRWKEELVQKMGKEKNYLPLPRKDILARIVTETPRGGVGEFSSRGKITIKGIGKFSGNVVVTVLVLKKSF